MGTLRTKERGVEVAKQMNMVELGKCDLGGGKGARSWGRGGG